MTDRDMEKKLRSAFEKVTPNVLDAVLTQCEQQKGTVIPMTNKRSSRRTWVRVASMAAAFALILGLGFGFYSYNNANSIDSVIALDINPSLEIKLNKDEKVIRVDALNEDGKKVIGDMDLKGSDLDVAVNALLGSMLRQGYLSDLANSILVSVESKDPAKSAALQKEVSAKVSDILSGEAFQGAVLSQSVAGSDKLQTLADQHSISLGKAQLIQQIVSQNNRYTFEDLVALSINELNLLTISGGHKLDGINASGTASDKGYIGAAEAKKIALEHAGVAEQDLRDLEIEMDVENGVMVYDVDFDTNEFEYDYEINATNGQILKNKKEDNSYKSNGTVPDLQIIDPEAAKAAALQHAGIAADNILNFKWALDRRNSQIYYEVSFDSGSYEYEYDIDAVSGTVIRWEKDYDDDRNGGNSSIAQPDQLISQEEAKTAALAHAGVAADSIRGYEWELERDGGLVVYEISFYSGSFEYDYHIDAKTGNVTCWSKEGQDRDDDTVPPGGYIGSDAAKAAALSHAGVAADGIREYEWELEAENGAACYEISFKVGNMEYEYKIDAVTGAVLHSETEIDD